jgi:hypothetical protein
MGVTYFVAVQFDRNKMGELKPGEPKEFQSAAAAEKAARSMAIGHAGVVAFSRAGDPSIGEFQDAVVLVQFGEVDLDALRA